MGDLKILLLSYHYPPTTKVGGKRWMHLAKEFIRHGCELDVITPRTKFIENTDYSLDIPANVHRVPVLIHSISSRRNSSLVMLISKVWHNCFKIIDKQEGWILPAITKALSIIEDTGIQLIIASGPPFSTFAAAAIVSSLSNLPLVLEYRDPWSNNPGRSFPRLTGRFWAQVMEKIILKQVDAAVFCTDRMHAAFSESFRNAIKDGYSTTITNGLSSISNVSPSSETDSIEKSMLYAGHFYGGRSINMIASAAQKYVMHGVPLTISIAGPKLQESERTLFAELAPNVKLEELGWIDYCDVRKAMESADVLFLPSGRNHSYAIPFKFFDYLQAHVPILAIAPFESAVKDIVQETYCGEFASIDNPEEIEQALFGILTGERTYSWENTESFHWDVIGLKYLEFLKKILIDKTC
jgi:glycosyltransferase involved in cell wall biosynthesis